jgi:hypothetical protein
MFPATTKRVAANTADETNLRIRQQTEARLAYYADHPEEIPRRLAELDREWDIERLLEANAATLALAGTVLGATVNKRFLLLPAMVTAFLLQHALQGWCPPVPVFRRLGVRTAGEIEQERYGLKLLRGDFRSASGAVGAAIDRARQALSAILS